MARQCYLCIGSRRGGEGERSYAAGLWRSVGASLVLSMYANVLLVVLVPSFLQYGIERSLKRSFLEQKQGPSARQQQGSAAAAATPATAQDAKFKTESKQPLMTLLCTVLLIMTACLASWHACIAAAAHMQHTCG